MVLVVEVEVASVAMGSALAALIRTAEAAPVEPPDGATCCYPLCDTDGDIKLVKCGVNGCQQWFHHLCAVSQGDDAYPARCFVHFMEDASSGTQVAEFPRCTQKHRSLHPEAPQPHPPSPKAP